MTLQEATVLYFPNYRSCYYNDYLKDSRIYYLYIGPDGHKTGH